MSRAELATKANDTGHASWLAHRTRRHPPRLEEASPRESIVAWLQWNDPNGCHTDELAAKEDGEPYTLDTAWDALALMLEDA